MADVFELIGLLLCDTILFIFGVGAKYGHSISCSVFCEQLRITITDQIPLLLQGSHVINP